MYLLLWDRLIMHYIRCYNDLHNNHQIFDIPVLPHEGDTVLSLAGDIYDRKNIMPWVQGFCHRFKAVLIVLGNHDYWNGSYELVIQSIKKYIIEHNLTNVHLLANEFVRIDDIVYFGGTMWTNFNNNDPLTHLGKSVYRDYKRIRYNNYSKKWSTSQAYLEHWNFLAALDQMMRYLSHDEKVVVITHHGPTQMSIGSRYKEPTQQNYIHNGFYVSELSNHIMRYPMIKLWHHGHVHEKLDYKWVNGIRVIVNSRGYGPDRLVKDFDPNLTIESTSFQLIQLVNN